MTMKTQIPIYETENFYIQAASRPFVDRAEGGHRVSKAFDGRG